MGSGRRGRRSCGGWRSSCGGRMPNGQLRSDPGRAAAAQRRRHPAGARARHRRRRALRHAGQAEGASSGPTTARPGPRSWSRSRGRWRTQPPSEAPRGQLRPLRRRGAGGGTARGKRRLLQRRAARLARLRRRSPGRDQPDDPARLRRRARACSCRARRPRPKRSGSGCGSRPNAVGAGEFFPAKPARR